MATPVRLKDIPLEATSFADVDEFILDSSANGTRTISGANIKTQLGGLFVKPLDSIADLSTEAAGAGYVRIVSDLDLGGAFKAVNGGTADNVTIFSSATVGWTWQKISGWNTGEIYYVHAQNYPDVTWVINHNLMRFPGVTIIDGSKNEVVGDIAYINQNSLTVTFSSEQTGTAYLI